MKKALNSLTDAAVHTFEKTRLGTEIKKIEQYLSKYFVLEYSKDANDGKATFYYPGHPGFEEKQKKDYKISLSSLFYADADSLDGNYSLDLDIIYYSFEAKAQYDCGYQESIIMLKNNSLNKYLHADMVASIISATNAEAYLLEVSWNF